MQQTTTTRDNNLFFFKAYSYFFKPLNHLALIPYLLAMMIAGLFIFSVMITFGTIFFAYSQIKHKDELFFDYLKYLFGPSAGLIALTYGLRKLCLNAIKTSEPQLIEDITCGSTIEFASKHMNKILSNEKVEIRNPLLGTSKLYTLEELAFQAGEPKMVDIIHLLHSNALSPFFEALYKINKGTPEELIEKILGYIKIQDIKLPDDNEKITRIDKYRGIEGSRRNALDTHFTDAKSIMFAYRAYVGIFHNRSNVDIESQQLTIPLLGGAPIKQRC